MPYNGEIKYWKEKWSLFEAIPDMEWSLANTSSSTGGALIIMQQWRCPYINQWALYAANPPLPAHVNTGLVAGTTSLTCEKQKARE